MQTAFLGDLFLTIPLLKRLRSLYPHDRLILVCKKNLGAYFLKEKFVDHIFEVQKGDRYSYLQAVKELNQIRIETVFCIHRSIRSQLMSFQIKAKRKIGFKSVLGSLVFTETVSYQSKWPDPLRQLWLLSPIDPVSSQDLSGETWENLNRTESNGRMVAIPEKFAVTASRQSHQPTRKIAIFPGSVWATKKWTLSGFTELSQMLIQNGYQVFLMGGPDEKSLCEQVHHVVPETHVLAGQKSILESVEFIATCDLVVSNDSAPAHMASSQNVPVVALFGPTTLNLGFRPWSSNAFVVQNNSLTCRPCGKHGHQKCPLKHHHCMTQITAEQVLIACQELLTR
ncbi:MAG: hypothetical protein A2622_01250 [Bdellovibrionales bacterium RIFCSPHIGHO2_01_FULL_40_29]|nr:MAG: hypothetical protein A2622_01250 [Bdellovibrionales bacterium RIFCSPHIGHO2_01_FULL_40_29]OFZ32790.1 MAG: hypothetical protein A3D17_05850 [Bdellovibrionales bacterium RIFCSPHIGHO2_02_FULL_40_15]